MPAAYEGEKGFEFIKEIPTTWDITKVIDAEVSKFVCIARKRDNDWYVGAIGNNEPRSLNIPLKFLEEGNYSADIYTDTNDTDKYTNHLNIESKTVTKDDVLHISVAKGGGLAIHFQKQ